MRDSSDAENSSSPFDKVRKRSSLRRAREIVLSAGEAIPIMQLLGWTAAAVVAIAILWRVPQWQVAWEVAHVQKLKPIEQFNSENEARKTLAQILGGIVVLAGGFTAWRNLKLAQEGQITDRYTKAIEQLGAVDASGNKKLEVRLGGIYALERIAKDSKRDHWPIMEVLCTYVRENAPNKPENASGEGHKQQQGSP